MKISHLTFLLFLSLISGFSHAIELSNADEKTLIHEANVALAQKDYATAFTKFATLAEHGISLAQFNLGAFYLNGQGVQKDEKLAFEWFQKSAAQGNSRALQVIENAAAKGNVYANSELKKLQDQTLAAQPQPQPQPQPQSQPQAQAQAQAQPEPKIQPREDSRTTENTLAFMDPTVAPRNKWGYGISADIFSNRISEPLPYSVTGITNTTTKSYGYTQPGVSAWMGYGDISVMASYRSGSGTVNAITPNTSSISKSFHNKDIEIDVRWLIRALSSNRAMPYVLAAYAQSSKSGTADELEFQDIYSQKDNLLLVGAGAIFPINEKAGIRVEAKLGPDSQKHSGSYVAGPGVTLSFNSYSYTTTSVFSGLAATMYYNVMEGLNAQLGARYEKYSGGTGYAYSVAGIYAKLGYSFK